MRFLLLYVAIFSFCITVHADQWRLEPLKKDTEYVFEDSKIVLSYDSTFNSQFPYYSISVYKNGALQEKFLGKGFSEVFSSKDHKYFLGLSNSGLIRQRFILFDVNGKMLKENMGNNVRYCHESITLHKVWFDEENPKVEFIFKEEQLTDVLVNSCDGTRLSLFKI